MKNGINKDKIVKQLSEMELSTDNLVSSFLDLLEVLHQNGLDEQTKYVMNKNGITLEIKVK